MRIYQSFVCHIPRPVLIYIRPVIFLLSYIILGLSQIILCLSVIVIRLSLVAFRLPQIICSFTLIRLGLASVITWSLSINCQVKHERQQYHYKMLHSSDVSILFLVIEFGGRTSICGTINTLCMPRFVLINLTTAPTITSSIIERPSFKGDIRVRTCLYIISHNFSSSTASIACIPCKNAISAT